jgi:hypothetical protein
MWINIADSFNIFMGASLVVCFPSSTKSIEIGTVMHCIECYVFVNKICWYFVSFCKCANNKFLLLYYRRLSRSETLMFCYQLSPSSCCYLSLSCYFHIVLIHLLYIHVVFGIVNLFGAFNNISCIVAAINVDKLHLVISFILVL